MGKIITIAGIKRSGTTWMYNVVRLIAWKYGTVAISGYDPESPDIDKTKDFNIVKLHPFHEWLAKNSIVLTSYRDEDGIRMSLKRFTGKDIKIGWMLKNLNKWRAYSAYEMDFKNVGSLEEIKRIGKAIGLGCSAREIKREVDQIKPDNEYNETTFLFPNHITNVQS